MPTFQGAFFKNLDYFVEDILGAIYDGPRTSPQIEQSGFLKEDHNSWEFAEEQPISIRNIPQVGAHFRTYFDDYYNRVYFIPAQIDFGPVSASVSREIIVWNAHLWSTTLETISVISGSGLSLTGPETPNLFKPLALKRYTLTALEDGPPVIEATFTWSFNGLEAEVHSLPVTGTRARISPLVPNWREPFRVTYEFKTDITTSHTGKEQRRSLRATPRKKIDFTATVSRRTARLVNENMAFWHSRAMILAEEPKQVVSSAGMSPGMNFIQLDEPAPLWLVVNSNVILAYRSEIRETRKVTEIVDGNILLFESISQTEFPPGTKVMAAVSGTFPVQLVSKRHTDTAHEYAVTLNVTPTSEIAIPLPGAPLVFENREVWLQKPNWGNIPDVTHEQPVSQVDYGRGKIARFMPVEFATRINKFNYIGRNFLEANAALELFYRMKGQRGEFYMPTWENDLIPALTTPEGGNYVRTAGLSILDNYENDTVHRAIAIFPRDGSPPLLRRIESIYRVEDEQGVDTVIQFTPTTPIPINVETVRMISWMPVWRLASDNFELSWVTNSVAQYALTMRSLEDLP